MLDGGHRDLAHRANRHRCWWFLRTRDAARRDALSAFVPCAAVLAPLRLGARDALFVEAALEHRVRFAHEDMGRDLVLGAAEFAEGREQNQVIERLFRQRQTDRTCLRTIFRSRHSQRLTTTAYNGVIMAF